MNFLSIIQFLLLCFNVLVCGMKRVPVQTLVVDGNYAEEGDYPWMVGIYNETYDQICGGSVVKENLVISGIQQII